MQAKYFWNMLSVEKEFTQFVLPSEADHYVSETRVQVK